jgi:predicted DNA-binding protein (MmcQ/YjbR family)
MDVERVRKICLGFSGATEEITWGDDLTFRVAGKIFAVTVLVPAPVWLSFKCSPENFGQLTERAGIIPAPYLARAQWVALQEKDALAEAEISALLRESYEMVLAKLPRKTREAILLKRGPQKKSGAAKRGKRVTAKKKRDSSR